MSYIEPNTDIYLLEGVPLDPDYENVMYFPIVFTSDPSNPQPFTKENFERASYQDIRASRNAQANHLLDTYNHFTFTRQTYQRINKNTIRVHKNAESLLRINYIVFRNTNFQDTGTHTANEKWFYGFVTRVDYINNEVAEITYEIDVMMSWWFDYYPNTCYVEREHTESDLLFEHIVEEDVAIGNDYVANSMPEDFLEPYATGGSKSFDMNEQTLCILVNRKTSQHGDVSSYYVNNMVLPVRIITVDIDPNDIAGTITQIDSVLDTYLESEIICIYQFPKKFSTGSGSAIRWDFAIAGNFSSLNYIPNIDGYQPRNKKLFIYPYNFLQISNNCGQTAILKWENFSSLNHDTPYAHFNIDGVYVPNAVAFCYPVDYKRIHYAYDEGLMYTNFPQNAWSGDVFKNWWTQNKGSFITSNISSVISNLGGGFASGAAAGIATGNALLGVGVGMTTAGLSSVLNLSKSVASSIGKIRDVQATPQQTHGHVQTDALNAAIHKVQFDFYRMSIKAKQAQIIDEYFDRFGYACKRVKYPNRLARREWTYTKTIGCTLGHSKLPCDDEKKICSIYDKGVTFWVNDAHIGDYTLPNNPIN